MRMNLIPCLGLCTNGQYESRDNSVVLVPHQSLHGSLRIINELCQAPIKVWAIEKAVPLIHEGTIGAE